MAYSDSRLKWSGDGTETDNEVPGTGNDSEGQAAQLSHGVHERIR